VTAPTRSVPAPGHLGHPDRTTEAQLLAAVADPIRLAVLASLATGPRCACDLQRDLSVATNLLSYHLRVLRDSQLITRSRRGRQADYALAPDALDRLHAALPARSRSTGIPAAPG
jgi:ArsR family transcriptional regulator, arsenate/arsenite/antimonite-responsive transcriptional repressor